MLNSNKYFYYFAIMIFVTGGTGFLGANILAKLAIEGIAVRVLKRKNSSTDFLKKTLLKYGVSDFYNKIEWVEGDILDYALLLESLNNVEYVIHSAAIISFDKHKSKSVTSDNIKGTSNLIDASISNNVKRFCHISSIAAIGSTENGELINENTEWLNNKGNSAYSISKYYSELQVWRGVSEGLSCVIVNPSVLVGSGNWETDFSSIFTKVNKGLKYYTTGSSGFVDVSDVAEIVKQLTINSEVSGERFIVSSENIEYKNLLTMIAESLNRKIPSKEVSENLLNIMNKLNSITSLFFGKSVAISSDLARIANKKLNYSNNKINDLLNYNFKPIKELIYLIAKEFNESMK